MIYMSEKSRPRVCKKPISTPKVVHLLMHRLPHCSTCALYHRDLIRDLLRSKEGHIHSCWCSSSLIPVTLLRCGFHCKAKVTCFSMATGFLQPLYFWAVSYLVSQWHCVGCYFTGSQSSLDLGWLPSAVGIQRITT